MKFNEKEYQERLFNLECKEMLYNLECYAKIPEAERLVYWFGDLAIHCTKNGVTDENVYRRICELLVKLKINPVGA